MTTIYKITNTITNKVYVGQTTKTLKERLKQHIHDSRRKKYQNRALYKDFQKYGIEAFTISALETCDDADALEREEFWITQLDAFNNGYNATKGGVGKRYIDYDEILNLWNEGYAVTEITKMTGYGYDGVSDFLRSTNVSSKEIKDRYVNLCKHPVAQIDMVTNEILQVFDSVKSAKRALEISHSGHIADVCNGKRKSASGYFWKYVNE